MSMSTARPSTRRSAGSGVSPVNVEVDLPHRRSDRPDRVGNDRLEILAALINASSFDLIFRSAVVEIPRDHPIYPGWR
jgi:hypothetical protein